MRRPTWIAPLTLFAMSAVSALAQEQDQPDSATTDSAVSTGHQTYAALIHMPYVGMWLAAVLICYVIFVVGAVLLFQRGHYPPNVARLGWWLAAVSFSIWFVFYLIGHVLGIAMPGYAIVILFALLFMAAFALLATRRRVTR